MKRILLAAALVIAPTVSLADSQLDRLEDISERMNDAMFEMMIREAVKEGANPTPLREAIPDAAWDDPMREAGQCMLDRFVGASSKSAVSDMLDKMDAAIPKMAELDIDTMAEEFDFLPDGVSDELSIQINSECGVAELMMERMDASGFMRAMMEAMG